MDKIIYLCGECGSVREMPELYKNLAEVYCLKCGDKMEIVDNEDEVLEDNFSYKSNEEEMDKKLSLDEIIDIDLITYMRRQLKQEGSSVTWDRIERCYNNATQRGRIRQLFFRAGGVMPERELEK